jgi:hypothetical protein
VTWAIIATGAAVIGAMAGLLTLQAVWIGRLFDTMNSRFDLIDQRLNRMDQRFDRIDQRLDRIEATVLRDHGERIARLEAR